MPIHKILIFTCLMVLSQAANCETSWTHLPVNQSDLADEGMQDWHALTAWQASRNDRWLGLEPRDLRWSVDGKVLYFRWKTDPQSKDDPELDPWFRVTADGLRMEQLSPDEWHTIPGSEVHWSADRKYSAWVNATQLYVWNSEQGSSRAIFAGDSAVGNIRFDHSTYLDFSHGKEMLRYRLQDGSLKLLAVTVPGVEVENDKARWLESQQQTLFDFVKELDAAEAAQKSAQLARSEPHKLELKPGFELESVTATVVNPVDSARQSGNELLLWVERKTPPAVDTKYMDFVNKTGNASELTDRPKVGVLPSDYMLAWYQAGEQGHIELPIDTGMQAQIHPLQWSPGGSRAVVQVSSQLHKDRWVLGLDVKSKTLTVLVHEHDDAWLGGPPPVAGYLTPAWLQWLDEESFVFASERSGWSHLYLYSFEAGKRSGDTQPGQADQGTVKALTKGEWEVRDAQLSDDKKQLLVTASKEDPSDDHLYRMSAKGGPMQRISDGEGRHNGVLSPDAKRLAVLSSDNTTLPDLYLQDFKGNARQIRLTRSGTDNYYQNPLIKPEVVSFPHPDDGKPVWAMIYRPPLPNGAAVLHIHGGGYRHFSHRGWSVYGYSLHLGQLNHLLGQGYTVLDFDYRGGAGYGRDYRTDIYRDMGNKDITGALAGIDYLVENESVDRKRIGVYGISYGGFFTLMGLFKHPGVFAAGVASAAVSDWAHYNHVWTSRILNLPTNDPEAYATSSPINFAAGLQDPLLIVHGLIDENVQFQDTARLIQKLIELEKPFDVMVYPIERHTIKNQSSRLDYIKRVDRFFGEYLSQKTAIDTHIE